MEEIPAPAPVEAKQKSATEKFIERIVAWAVLGGFVSGIFGAVFGLLAILFLDWEIPGVWILSPVFTSFLVGSLLGAVSGGLIGGIGGVIGLWFLADSSGPENHQPPTCDERG